MTDSITFAKFEPILEEFAKFQKFRQMKETSKMLEPQLNYKNSVSGKSRLAQT